MTCIYDMLLPAGLACEAGTTWLFSVGDLQLGEIEGSGV